MHVENRSLHTRFKTSVDGYRGAGHVLEKVNEQVRLHMDYINCIVDLKKIILLISNFNGLDLKVIRSIFLTSSTQGTIRTPATAHAQVAEPSCISSGLMDTARMHMNRRDNQI